MAVLLYLFLVCGWVADTLKIPPFNYLIPLLGSGKSNLLFNENKTPKKEKTFIFFNINLSTF